MNDQPIRLTPPPEGFADWLADLKGRIHTAQQRATLAVNRELVLYWHIGRDILARQAQQGWGTKVIERLAHGWRLRQLPAARWSSSGRLLSALAAPRPGFQITRNV